ncbi:LysE family translocator [Desulfobulbus propionicus]
MITTEFLFTALVVVLIPGTGVLYTVSTGLFGGWRASIAAAFGCTAGILPHILTSILGLSALLHTSALVFQVVKYAGVGYLLYLAWSMWRETGSLQFAAQGGLKCLRQVAVRGILINILNPKLTIFFLAFLPLFVSPSAASPLAQMTLLSAIFMAMTLVVFIGYGLAAHAVRRRIARSPLLTTWLQRSCAAIFAALGLKLAVAEQ